MGQYYKGKKIGTCESMYYMRLSEAQELAKQGARDDDGITFESYLTDNATMFRFPFPDEDEGIPANCQYDKGFNIPAGDLEDVGHSTICVGNTHKNGFHNMNIMIPCPYSKDFKDLILDGKVKQSNGGAGEQFLTVRFQAIRDGKEKTIFECSRCGQLQRFSDDDIDKIKERAKEYFECYNREGKNLSYKGDQGLYDQAIKIINRIK